MTRALAHKKVVGLFTLLVLSAGVAQSGAPRAVAGEELDPLVVDSLAALDSLVAAETCILKDAADNETTEDTELPFRLCDDGVPPQGGGSDGIPVPVAYHSNEDGSDYRGLPAPASEEEATEKDAAFDLQPEEDGRRITLDVNVTLPSASKPAPSKGFPVLVFMHGCCGGNKSSWEAPTVPGPSEKYRHSNAWYSSRGYVIVTYTARGFRNSDDRGSTGTTQLDSRRFEINDYQYLVGLLVDHDAQQAAAAEPKVFNVNPRKVAAVGGSYGGGFSWLALTDPTWLSPATQTPIRLAAAVPRYGWTDLVESLVPGGHYRDRKPGTMKTEIAPVDIDKARSARPVGVEKQSIVTGLYGTGNNPSGGHTTFPDYLHETYARLQVGEPYDGDLTIDAALNQFLEDRSAYFQGDFWKRVKNGLRVPVYAGATWTDQLFPTMESVRFYSKLKSLNPKYPIEMYLGDYQHFTQNKAKEWGDICGDDHHVCTIDDFRTPGGAIKFGRSPNRLHKGIHTRLDRFLDYFVRGAGRKPPLGVTATSTICPANETEKLPVDEPGTEYRAPTWRKLATRLVKFKWDEAGTTSSLASDGHAAESDPVFRSLQTDKCYTTTEPDPGDGIVQYRSEPLAKHFTMMGLPSIKLDYATTATNYWVAVRLFDASPDQSMTMVTRGLCRVNTASKPNIDCSRFDLFGNGWRFRPEHEVVIEISQADTPFLRINNPPPSELDIAGATIEIPITSRKQRRDFRS